jgi:uncharacterized protein
MLGKAQALFSMLFGFGFAIFHERVVARGLDATRLYARRLSILFVIGLMHVSLVWAGDILHQYALAGFLLLLTLRWPDRVLLTAALVLSIALMPLLDAVTPLIYASQAPPWEANWAQAQELRWEVFRQPDYQAYVATNLKTTWLEWYSQPFGMIILALVFGRFLLGSWIQRKGWLQNPAAHIGGFRRYATILLAFGLIISAIRPALRSLDVLTGNLELTTRVLADIGMVVLALGYGAGIVVLCQSGSWRRRLSGLGAVGQMALTNYLTQSFFYLFVLYGFGLGLLPYLGATLALVLALVVFAAQIAFSRWWLARYRFGPLEWLWRSATYASWQPLRKQA